MTGSPGVPGALRREARRAGAQRLGRACGRAGTDELAETERRTRLGAGRAGADGTCAESAQRLRRARRPFPSWRDLCRFPVEKNRRGEDNGRKPARCGEGKLSLIRDVVGPSQRPGVVNDPGSFLRIVPFHRKRPSLTHQAVSRVQHLVAPL